METKQVTDAAHDLASAAVQSKPASEITKTAKEVLAATAQTFQNVKQWVADTWKAWTQPKVTIIEIPGQKDPIRATDL